uniref:Uncharacterized protein n=1 Tax=Noctiluca scintillans TaxID=2966 RepID=A0A7S0ZLQ1_NOCSC
MDCDSLEAPPDDEHEHDQITGRARRCSHGDISRKQDKQYFRTISTRCPMTESDTSSHCSRGTSTPSSTRRPSDPTRHNVPPQHGSTPVAGNPTFFVIDGTGSGNQDDASTSTSSKASCHECSRRKEGEAKQRLLKYYPPPVGDGSVRVDVIDDEAEMLIIRRVTTPRCHLP